MALGHEPFAYLKDVLTRLPTQPQSRIGALLPHRWRPESAWGTVKRGSPGAYQGPPKSTNCRRTTGSLRPSPTNVRRRQD